MFSPADTIVAIATPPGRGGLGIVRISGPDASRIGSQLTGRQALAPRHATFARITGAGGLGDQVIATFFPGPHSSTGDDVVEISAHGSPVLLQAIVERAIAAGARLAEPGEFTFRGFLNGRIDLVQAEAVRDLIESVTPAQARSAFDQLEGTLTARIGAIDRSVFELTARLEASLDFPGEGYHFVDHGAAAAELTEIADAIERLLHDAQRGRVIRDGAQVVITGRPNSGKSSLFNQLAGAGRAIVTAHPGTTRDLLTETIDLCGIAATLVDTAGIREQPGDDIEAEGISRAVSALEIASTALIVLDRSAPLSAVDRQLLSRTQTQPRVVAANKSDLAPAWSVDEIDAAFGVEVSALTGEGVDELRRLLAVSLAGREVGRDTPAITNVRHTGLLRQAWDALRRAAAAAAEGTPEEFVLADVHEARARLEEVTGRRTPDDVLGAIFSKFCIGK
jgi:tRNA modification GTPase